jgi:hypothetical protein
MSKFIQGIQMTDLFEKYKIHMQTNYLAIICLSWVMKRTKFHEILHRMKFKSFVVGNYHGKVEPRRGEWCLSPSCHQLKQKQKHKK